MTDKEYNTKNGTKWHPVLIAILGAILGSSGSIFVVFGTPLGQSVARPDPFTGTQAASLIADIRRVESDIDMHITRHPDKLNQFDRRITTLEVQFSQILDNQTRILNKLDGM